MRVIVCVDDNGGMLFNHRRQSRDRVLCERVLQMADERDCSVYMNTYSAKIFPEDNRIAVSENYLESRRTGFVFCRERAAGDLF